MSRLALSPPLCCLPRESYYWACILPRLALRLRTERQDRSSSYWCGYTIRRRCFFWGRNSPEHTPAATARGARQREPPTPSTAAMRRHRTRRLAAHGRIGSERRDPHPQRSLREIPSFRIIAFKVVRGTPRRVAAVLTTPAAARRTRMICSRSTCSSVLLAAASDPSARISAKGARSAGPRERMTDLSMKFSSSRTLPGHDQPASARIVSDGILSICLFDSLAYFLTKCR